MELIDALILGLVQGITEFLPLSSAGHLVLARSWLSIDTMNAVAFEGVTHLATALAVTIYFWSDFWVLVQAALRKLGRLPVNQKDLQLFKALALGSIPALALGLMVEPFIRPLFQNVALVAIILFAASVFFMYVEWRYFMRPEHGSITVKRGLLIGVYQALALLPGFSRVGATMAGGMLLGMSRYEAARFSFMLAVPLAVGMGCKKLLELLSAAGTPEWSFIIMGATTAALCAFIVAHLFLGYIKTHTLWPFIWYNVLLSAFVGYAAFVM